MKGTNTGSELYQNGRLNDSVGVFSFPSIKGIKTQNSVFVKNLKKKPVKLAITIPAFNEEKNIWKVLQEIPGKIDGIDEIEIIVINDGSTDNTSEIAHEMGVNKIINFPANKGLAIAFKEGLNAATDGGADIIVNIDADAQYNALEIPKLIKPILDAKAEIVLGSRFAGTIEHMVAQKRWGNRLATYVVGLASGLNVTDAQTGFRAFSREAALKLVVHSGYTYTQETIVQASHKRLTIVEVPVEFRRRNGDGQSRLISSITTYARNSIVTLVRTYTSYNPLKTFAYLGGSIFMLGIILGIRVIIHFFMTGMVSPYLPTALLSSVLAIIGFQIIVIGLIADISHQNRHIMEEVLYRMRKEGRDDKVLVSDHANDRLVVTDALMMRKQCEMGTSVG